MINYLLDFFFGIKPKKNIDRNVPAFLDLGPQHGATRWVERYQCTKCSATYSPDQITSIIECNRCPAPVKLIRKLRLRTIFVEGSPYQQFHDDWTGKIYINDEVVND